MSCNIVARLFEQRNNAAVEKILQQYKDKGNGWGYHVQNTLIDYATSRIIHYPSAIDFDQSIPVNVSQKRTALPFSKSSLEDALLKDALVDASVKMYVQQLTGLQNPEILVEIGDYFRKPAKLWFPWSGKKGSQCKEKRAAWLGCINNSLNLSGSGLNYDGVARGVRRSGEHSEP